MLIKKIERAALLEPLQIVIGIVERKQSLPILSNVLIEVNNSLFKFIATDLEIQISTESSSSQTNIGQYSITVSAKKLMEVLRVLPEDSLITLESSENRLQLKTNSSRFTLQSLPAQDFPKIAEKKSYLSKLVLPQVFLKKALNTVQYAMAQQDIRYYLNGILLIIDGNTLILVATDGHRLAYSKSESTTLNSKCEMIIPRKTINELSRLLSDTDDSITIELTEHQANLAFSNISLISKIIDGKFPDYQRVIPIYNNKIILNRLSIVNSLQRVSILSNEKFHGVRFVLTENNLRIISCNNSQEEAQEDIETIYSGDPLDIGFNINYLLDGLNSISSQQIEFAFGGPNSSILITIPENDTFKYVVMPMRI